MSKTLIKQIFLQDSFWAINKNVAHIYGLDVALFLSFLIDKHDKCVNDEQYFYATKKDAEYQTGLTRYQQDAAVKVLVDNGLLYARAIGLPPTMHYCIRYEQIAVFFENAKNLLIEKRKEMEKKEAEKKQKKDALISKKITNCSEMDLQNNITNNSLLKNQVSKKKSKSVVTDTPPLESNLSCPEIPTGCEKEKTGKPINLENIKTETLQKKVNSGGARENSQSDVSKLDIDAKIAPLGMSVEKLDFIFLEASRIDTPEIRAKFIEWHVRRAKETKGVRTCLHYQKIMREIANSDLEVWEVLQGFTMAYEACWQGIKIEWVKNRTRDKKQQNGTNQKQPQQPFTPKYATGI